MNQHEEIEHPFDATCTFKCYNNTAYPSGVFTAAYKTNASLLNYGILLFFPKALLGNRFDCVRLVPSVNWSLLARHRGIEISDIRANLHLGNGETEFRSQLLSALRVGYIQTYIDWFYLNEGPGYLRSHYKHETLISGYNFLEDMFSVPIWDRKATFRVVKVPSENIVKAFYSKEGWRDCFTYTDSDRSTGFCAEMRKPVYSIAITPGAEFTLDRSLIIKQIEDSLQSRCTYSSYVDDSLINWIEGDGVYGLAAYNAYIDYLSECVATKTRVDSRATRLLWEHKVIMIERLSILRQQGCVIDPEIDRSYKQIASVAKMIHWAILGDSVWHKNLIGIENDLIRIAQVDRESMSALLSSLRSS